jgi:hypothetical protein
MRNRSFFPTGWVLTAILVGVLSVSGIARAADTPSSMKTIVVLGSGSSKDVASARQLAIASALVSAVAQVAVDMLPPEALSKAFASLDQNLFSRADAFVRDYKVLAESGTGTLYRVLVQATVATDVLQAQLTTEGVTTDRNLPKLVLLYAQGPAPAAAQTPVQPAVAQTAAQPPVAQTSVQPPAVSPDLTFMETMAQEFRKKGFTLIDATAALQAQNPTGQEPVGSDPWAVTLGQQLQADVVVLVHGTVEPAQNTMGGDIRSFKGTVSARALRTDTSEQIAEATQSSVTANRDAAAGGQLALSQAGAQVAQSLAGTLADSWKAQQAAPTTIEIHVLGKNYLVSMVKFRKALSEMPGIKNVQTRELKPDEGVLVVDYQKDGKALASELMLKTFDGFGLNIQEATDTVLKIELISN